MLPMGLNTDHGDASGAGAWSDDQLPEGTSGYNDAQFFDYSAYYQKSFPIPDDRACLSLNHAVLPPPNDEVLPLLNDGNDPPSHNEDDPSFHNEENASLQNEDDAILHNDDSLLHNKKDTPRGTEDIQLNSKSYLPLDDDHNSARFNKSNGELPLFGPSEYAKNIHRLIPPRYPLSMKFSVSEWISRPYGYGCANCRLPSRNQSCSCAAYCLIRNGPTLIGNLCNQKAFTTLSSAGVPAEFSRLRGVLAPSQLQEQNTILQLTLQLADSEEVFAATCCPGPENLPDEDPDWQKPCIDFRDLFGSQTDHLLDLLGSMWRPSTCPAPYPAELNTKENEVFKLTERAISLLTLLCNAQATELQVSKVNISFDTDYYYRSRSTISGAEVSRSINSKVEKVQRIVAFYFLESLAWNFNRIYQELLAAMDCVIADNPKNAENAASTTSRIASIQGNKPPYNVVRSCLKALVLALERCQQEDSDFVRNWQSCTDESNLLSPLAQVLQKTINTIRHELGFYECYLGIAEGRTRQLKRVELLQRMGKEKGKEKEKVQVLLHHLKVTVVPSNSSSQQATLTSEPFGLNRTAISLVSILSAKGAGPDSNRSSTASFHSCAAIASGDPLTLSQDVTSSTEPSRRVEMMTGTTGSTRAVTTTSATDFSCPSTGMAVQEADNDGWSARSVQRKRTADSISTNSSARRPSVASKRPRGGSARSHIEGHPPGIHSAPRQPSLEARPMKVDFNRELCANSTIAQPPSPNSDQSHSGSAHRGLHYLKSGFKHVIAGLGRINPMKLARRRHRS